MNTEFDGAKLALYIGDKLAVILRDMKSDIPFPGYWDLPGGGREGDETPVQCVLRETHEELGLVLSEDALIWVQEFEMGEKVNWFFVARQPAALANSVVFGDEGQRWTLMDEAEFLNHPKAVPQFQTRLKTYLLASDFG